MKRALIVLTASENLIFYWERVRRARIFKKMRARTPAYPGIFGVCLLVYVVIAASAASAADSLLYLEAQGIAGYSSMDEGAVYHSGHRHDTMQKNGIGIDYIKKFSGEYGDWGTGALQLRLVWEDADNKPQFQVYNAWLKLKTAPADVWFGHNRAPFGLTAYLDTHAELLQPLSMYGFGFDRDWGAGISRDFANGDFSTSLTLGSGMALKAEGNWIASSRVSYGVLPRDNYNIGVSIMGGKRLNAMGYEVMDEAPATLLLGGADFAWNHDRIEHKAEFDMGQMNDMAAAAVFYRIGVNLLEENRLKFEAQYVWTKQSSARADWFGLGAAYKVDSNLTARVMYQRDMKTRDNSVIFQLYYYRLKN